MSFPAKRGDLAPGMDCSLRGKRWKTASVRQIGEVSDATGKRNPIESKGRSGCVWQFRWSEKDLNGHRVYRKRVIGTVDEYTDQTAVRQAASVLLSDVNLRSRQARLDFITVDQLCAHFEQREMRSGASLWSVATARTYRGYIRLWIRPRWGSRSLDEIKAVEVEAWLRGLDLARGSRAKIRNVFSVLFNHACRHELFDRNPIRSFVRVPNVAVPRRC